MHNKGHMIKGALRATFITAAALALGACTSTKMINSDIYHSADELTQRVATLHKGMNKQEVLSVLGKDISSRWVKLNNSQINEVRCGCEPNAGSYKDMQKMADELLASEGFEFNYSEVKKKWAFTGLHTKIKMQGDDVTIRIVFTDNKLVAWDQGGGPVNEKDKNFILKGAEDALKLVF